MGELTFKDIKKAMKTLKQCGTEPAKFYTSESHAIKIIVQANEMGIKTKGQDGNDYILGMKVITHPDLDDHTCYISET